MEEFEYSVEISDRDWDCFFMECEECNILPPALAGVDDSGMSDMDEMGSVLADRARKVDPAAGFLEFDHSIDGPPDCEGSPVEHYLGKYGVGGIECVLSGSEEDRHLESVNTFFERLKSLKEAEMYIEPSQGRVGKNREAAQGEELCSDGLQASCCALPKTIPKLNSLRARSETAVGKETTETVNASSNINTMKKDESVSKISPGLAASNSTLVTNKSAHPETELFIREEAWVDTTSNEVRKRSQSHESHNVVVCSDMTPDSDKVVSSEIDRCKLLDNVKQKDLLMGQAALNKTPNTESPSNLQVMAGVKLDRGKNLCGLLPEPDVKSSNKGGSKELSPSPSNKKRRRKKKRISIEPTESGHGYESQFLANQTDSEEEPLAWRRGVDPYSSADSTLSNMNKTETTDCLTAYSANSNLPLNMTAMESKVSCSFPSTLLSVSQCKNFPESLASHGRCTAPDSPENNTTNDRSLPPSGQTDDSVISTQHNGDNVTTNLQPCSKLQPQELTGLNKQSDLPASVTACAAGKSDLASETGNCDRLSLSTFERQAVHEGSVRQSDKINHSLTSCENEKDPEFCTADVTPVSYSILPIKSNYPALEAGTKSGLAAEVRNTGGDNHMLCQREPEPPQQLEIGCHSAAQYSSAFEKTDTPLSTVTIGSSAQEQPVHETETQRLQTRPCSSCDVNPSTVACTELSMSVDLLKSQSDITSTLSCSTLEGDQSCRTPSNEDVMSRSNKNITDMSGSSCSSVGLHNSGSEEEKISKVLATDEEGEGTSGPKSLDVSRDTSELKCDLEAGTEDAHATSKAENEVEKGPDCKHTVYAMSSFWREMEKLTIKDILGLRMMSSAAPPGPLPPVPETDTANTLDATDSGYFTQPDQSSEGTSSIPGLIESNSDAVLAIDSSSSVDVMWESEPDQVSLGENMMLTSVSDIPQPLIASNSNAPKYLKKMSKNVSVRNLHALDSEPFSVTWKTQALPPVVSEEVELENKSFPHGHMPRRDSGLDSLPSSSFTGNAPNESYSISLTDIFQYLFGGKQSNPSPSATDNTAVYSDGNSLPEAYDHFFSEFDTGSFFYPLIKAADPSKDELVPIFSCSRSTNRNLQFPEAYEHFFASSSSDDSSTESDEDDNEDRGPVRVVTRLNTQGSASQISTDIYENFFSDGDHRQNFFWKNTFSLRNIRLTGSTSQMQRSDSLSLLPVRQSGRSLRRTIQPISALGNQDVPFPDPLLYHLEERISRQLAQQPFRYEDLQTAVSNPRLDASLLPLRQSDMCLVCIAFASWVLKTANPQVGDAWKAVLLANVSALSAIRYLRKYVRVEAADGERALRHTSV